MDIDKEINNILNIDTDIINILNSISEFKVDNGYSVNILSKISIYNNVLTCTFSSEFIPVNSLKDKFSIVNNIFNDTLPCLQYFSIESIISKYSLLNPEKCRDIISNWKQCISNIKDYYKEISSFVSSKSNNTLKILSLLGIDEFYPNFHLKLANDDSILAIHDQKVDIDCTKEFPTTVISYFTFLRSYYSFHGFNNPFWEENEFITIEGQKITKKSDNLWYSFRLQPSFSSKQGKITITLLINKESYHTHLGVIPANSPRKGWLGGLAGWGFSSHSSLQGTHQILGSKEYKNTNKFKYGTGDIVTFTIDFKEKSLSLIVNNNKESLSKINYNTMPDNLDFVISLAQNESSVTLQNISINE